MSVSLHIFKYFFFRYEEWTHGLDKKKQPLFVIQDGQNIGKESFFECMILYFSYVFFLSYFYYK